MKILLVNPPIPQKFYNREFYLPSGLLYLASALKNNGDEVKILDFKTLVSKFEKSGSPQNFYEDILIQMIIDFSPSLIGLGCLYSGHFSDILHFSKLIKKKFKNISIMAGGIHFTIYSFEILSNCSSIDWIILGEGERTAVKLVNSIKNNSYEFEAIDGLAFRKGGEVFVNPKKEYIENIDSIPYPAYELINLEDYYVDTSSWHNPKNLPINTTIPIITSRSCPNRCPFCSMFMAMGPKWRGRSAENVIDEMEYLYNEYNHRHFSFMDDNFTLQRERTLKICRLIVDRKLNIQFETPNGLSIKTLDEEVLDALVEAGLVKVSLAIESGSEYIRNQIMRKNVSQKKILETVRLTKKYKQLYVKAFFIIGLPEETKETLRCTYDLIKEIDVDRVYVQNIVPYPCTEIFEQALRDELLIDIDVDNLYKAEELYMTNYRQFFIKPYNLDLKDLIKFRELIDGYLIKSR